MHHFMNVGGRDRFWPCGSAGCLPNGTSAMGTTVDPRTTNALGMNIARVQHCIAAGDDDHENRVWFDDVVVSTERIGRDDY
ncbi:MAG TPA: hypothetical protein RMH99_00340 [Sandaracinaceae bacterium LLY-WYZ-13_1]|nr:hypothetical protein [Sandaracinaceae bacterium LLY-WYZ-13_1]